MRRTSQDGGDSTSLSSMIDSDHRRSSGAAGNLKNTRNSIKRKVQNFGHEYDDAVIEPLLKNVPDTSQSAKFNLSKAKTEPESGDNQESSLIIANGFTDNLPNSGIQSFSVLNDKNITTDVQAIRTQVLVDIECKPTTQNASPLIFTTAKIHAEGKSNQSDTKLITPVPIVSTAASKTYVIEEIVNDTNNGIINDGEFKNAKPDKTNSEISPQIQSILKKELNKCIRELDSQTCPEIMPIPTTAKGGPFKNTTSNGTIKGNLNKVDVISFVNEIKHDIGITTTVATTTSVKMKSPVVLNSKLENSVKTVVDGTGIQKYGIDVIADDTDRTKSTQTESSPIALKKSQASQPLIKGVSIKKSNEILAKQKKTTADNLIPSSSKTIQKETQTRSIKSSSNEKEPVIKHVGAKSEDIPKKIASSVDTVQPVQKISTTDKPNVKSDANTVTKKKTVDSRFKSTLKKSVSISKEKSVPEPKAGTSTNQSATETPSPGNATVPKLASTNKQPKNVPKKVEDSSAKGKNGKKTKSTPQTK